MNKVRKGNYYRKKTIDWLTEHGYDVAIFERNQRIYQKDGSVINIKQDVWGCDLVAKNEDELIFIQCKSRAQDVNSGIKQMKKYKWPPFVKLQVIYWEERAKEPTVVEVSSSD
jgi:Holliday junction resolvase-like predicted endonuclease